MVNQELVDYIQAELANGFNPQQLKGFLIQSGYSPFEIDDAMNHINKTNKSPSSYQPHSSQPSPSGKTTAYTGVSTTTDTTTNQMNMQSSQLNKGFSGDSKIKNRNIFLVYLFSFITFGIYSIYWFISTKNEMNSLGAQIPTAWLLIIPFVNFYWLYKYCEGFALFVKKDSSPAVWFILTIFVGFIIPGFVQSALNKLAG